MDRKCKRIIDGKTYNTETATQVAGWADGNREDGPWDSGRFLYQNRHSAFFLYSYLDGTDEQDFDKIEPYTPEQAREWLEKNCSWNPDLIESLFGAMPEAGLGEVKYTLRLPESLRDRLAIRAKANQQSLNAWIVRCLESCAAEPAAEADSAASRRDIPPMGLINRTGWGPKGT
jgi:HicB family